MPGLIQQHSGNERSPTHRETTILQAIVQLFILHGSPVGSRNVSKFLERTMPLSPASVRNTMMDLEDLGFIMHPHTSAGRIPTDKGYRFYVDSLAFSAVPTFGESMQLPELSSSSRQSVARDASRVLSSLSRHLALVQIPQLKQAVVRRVELVQLAAERLLVVIELDSDSIRTISLETTFPIERATLDNLHQFVNERLAGKPLSEINERFMASADQMTQTDPALLRLFVSQLDALTRQDPQGQVHVSGTTNLIDNEGLSSPNRIRSVIELIENEDVIVHLLGSVSGNDGIAIKIGNEMNEPNLADYSLIATTYRAGSAHGSLGIIGPRRMDYRRMISIVQMMSSVLTSTLNATTPDSAHNRL